MTTPIEDNKQVSLSNGITDNPPIANAKQSVSEVIKMEPAEFLTEVPIHSIKPSLSILVFLFSSSLSPVGSCS